MLSHVKPNPIQTVLASAALALFCQHAAAADVAPYFGQWEGSMMEARNTAGMTSAILSFAVTRGSCVLEPGFMAKLPEARNYVSAGNRLYISWGGAEGVYAEEACSDDQLFSLMERVMQESGTRRFDFDIEGRHLYDTNAHARRARVLARLQARYPDMQVVFSLPGWLHGFSAESMNLLRISLSHGVRIDSVIVMSQSFGLENLRTMVSPSTVGQATIVTFRAAANQLMGLFPNRTPAQLHAMMGITTMIGRNDDGSTFTLADARTVTDFVIANSVGILSYWSFGRDRAGRSGVSQADYEFHRIFKAASGGVMPRSAPAPAPAPAPTSAPAPAPATSTANLCSSTAWVQGRSYAAGAVVSYGGRLYIATHANPGYNPTISTYFWSQYLCGGSTSAPAPAPAPAPAASTACSFPAWVQGRQYAAGAVVAYGGSNYIARHANPGYIPNVSTYFWAPHGCGTSTSAPAPAPVSPAACSFPAWVQGRYYAAGAVVAYGGANYAARHANPGYIPNVSTYYWARHSC
jgi:chitodextrinase